MPVWIIYTLIATVMGGVTAIFVKTSIGGMNTHQGLVIRLAIVFVMAIVNLILAKGYKEPMTFSNKTLFYLILSGITTGLCWIFYYKAIDIGNVSVITAIEKGSIVITLLLAIAFLGEPFTLKLGLGAGLIVLGMLVLVWK
jgi:transporter family protein